MKENQSTHEIIKLIDYYLQEKKISNEELSQIAFYCLSLLDTKEDIIKSDNNYKIFVKNSFEKFKLSENYEEIPKKDADNYINEFWANNDLKNHVKILNIKPSDLATYVDEEKDLDIYFGDSGGQLILQLGEDDGSFTNSNIKAVFDSYCNKNNPNNLDCPRKITVPLLDVEEVYKYLTSSTNARAYFQTAVSLSSNNSYKGRVIVLLVCDTGSKTIKYYDTFKLCPPDGAC